MGFGLIIGFMEYLQIVTTKSYGGIANSYNMQYTVAFTKMYLSVVSSPVSSACVPCWQLTSHSSDWYLKIQLYTPAFNLRWTISKRLRLLTDCPTNLFCLQHLGMYRIENTSPNSTSIVACETVVIYRPMTEQRLLYSCSFHGRCPATNVYVTIRTSSKPYPPSRTVPPNITILI
jgi:hypothetical protein